ncbi:MAG TPA: GNAT family N-acetyltransferase [Polyangiaceae bacterium]|nr:GNAT family N-acetyltransferase [Polyangiaceae bacterium]
MLVDTHGLPLPPSWWQPSATRVDALRELRARSVPFDPGVLEAAAYYCDWPLVRELYLRRLEREQACAAHHAALGLALLREGDVERARQCSIRAALLDPRERGGQRLQWELSEWEPWRRALPALPREPRSAQRLRLELLGPHHWQDLLWHYDDADISRLCGWPRFSYYTEWRAWLEREYAARDLVMFAVLENTWGFCGVVSLIRHRQLGLVYYWLGREFRGRGLAAEAVRCLLALSRELWGLRSCYANVFAENEPSRRLLERLGFELEGVALLPPHEHELVYRLGPPQSAAASHAELSFLLHQMRSDRRLRPRLAP